MAIIQRIEKRDLIITVGGGYDAKTGGELPASYRWKGVLFMTNEDGSEAAPPQEVTVPTTKEEAAAHMDARIPLLIADIQENAAVNNVLREENATLRAAVVALKEAEAHWESNARNAMVLALAAVEGAMIRGDEDFEQRTRQHLEKAAPILAAS